MRIQIVKRRYTPVVREWLETQVPARIVEFENDLADELRAELEANTPHAKKPANKTRQALRGGNDEYGPLPNSWRIKLATTLTEKAKVWTPVFYSIFVEYGTVHGGNRIQSIRKKLRKAAGYGKLRGAGLVKAGIGGISVRIPPHPMIKAALAKAKQFAAELLPTTAGRQ